MSEINCHGEITFHLGIEQATPAMDITNPMLTCLLQFNHILLQKYMMYVHDI